MPNAVQLERGVVISNIAVSMGASICSRSTQSQSYSSGRNSHVAFKAVASLDSKIHEHSCTAASSLEAMRGAGRVLIPPMNRVCPAEVERCPRIGRTVPGVRPIYPNKTPRMWYKKFDSHIRQLGYHQNNSNL